MKRSNQFWASARDYEKHSDVAYELLNEIAGGGQFAGEEIEETIWQLADMLTNQYTSHKTAEEIVRNFIAISPELFS